MSLSTRYWAKLEGYPDGSARYMLPTSCGECNLELHVWVDDDDWEMYTMLPVHRGTFWWRVKNAWKYIWTGEWPSGDFPLFAQDLDNLIDLLNTVKKEKKHGSES
jgi:hypothetical protein